MWKALNTLFTCIASQIDFRRFSINRVCFIAIMAYSNRVLRASLLGQCLMNSNSDCANQVFSLAFPQFGLEWLIGERKRKRENLLRIHLTLFETQLLKGNQLIIIGNVPSSNFHYRHRSVLVAFNSSLWS